MLVHMEKWGLTVVVFSIFLAFFVCDLRFGSALEIFQPSFFTFYTKQVFYGQYHNMQFREVERISLLRLDCDMRV